MKRVFSAFVAWIMIFITSISALPVSAAGSSAEYIKYVVPFISDQTKQTQVCGLSNESLLKDGVVLIPLETACEIAGATIKAETDEAVIASRNYVSWCCNYNEHKKQYLLVDWHTGKGDYYAAALNCLKGSWTGLASFKYCFDGNAGISLPVDDVYNTDITYDLYQGTLYVSFYEFLDMMGVKVDVITHERVNAIIDLYDNVINAFSNAKNRNDADTIKKIFKDRVGYEQFFFCVLGTPIDALYQRYYDNHLQFKIDTYYSKNTVEWANLVNAVGNYEGLTKTAMAALNLNCDYEDALINVVKYHGSSANEDTTKVSPVIDVLQRMLVFADGAQNIKEICSDSNLSVSWDIQQKVNKQKPILSDGMGSKSQAVKASMTCISAFCCAAENYSKFKGLENLFLDEQYLLQNSILSSESFLDDVYEENKIDIDSTLGMLIPNFKTEKDIIDNLKNTSNSYFNLYHSASKVQLIMDTSSPAAYSAVLGAIEDVAYSLADDALMSMIDAAFFGGAPVSSLVNDRVMVSVYHLNDGVYGKKSASISELDDYAFLQLVAKDCFREYDLESENAYSSFLLGLKATMLAYRSASIDANGDPNGEIPKELSDIYNQSCFASTDIYDASPGKCSNLTDVLGNNTDISMVDTVPHQGLTLEFQSGDNIKRGVYESDNIKVIVSDESNSKCKIRIEQIHGFSERGVYYYSGPLSEEIDFEGNDGNSNNAYHIVFDVDSLHLTIRQLYITNEVSGWEFSNVDETLHFSTDVIPNYDISSWTNDMIAEAINNYLQYLQSIGEWSGYYVLSSEINEDEKMVPIRSRTGQSEHDYVAHWKWGEDYACVGIAYSDVTTDIFHMTEYHDEKEHYLRSAIEERGTLAVWAYADYDGNGEKEAFAITTTGDEDEIQAIYFVDSDGNVSLLHKSFDGLSYYENEEGYYRMHAGKGFFWFNYGAYGSGCRTMLYSVKDGIPYELDVAPQLQGFYQDGEKFYTTENSFAAGYHQWLKIELVYDSAVQQFHKGRVLGELE